MSTKFEPKQCFRFLLGIKKINSVFINRQKKIMKFVFLVDFRVHRKSKAIYDIFISPHLRPIFIVKNLGGSGNRKVGIFIYFSQILWGLVLWVTYGRILRKTCQNDFSNQYSFTKGKILIRSNFNDFTLDSHVISLPKLSIMLLLIISNQVFVSFWRTV